MNDILILLAGVICSGIGGELFVKGAVGLARHLRVSAAIVSVTFIAFATSSPELSVAISSAVAKEPAIALGDALGSNVLNIALILGITLAMGSIASSRKESSYNLLVVILAPIFVAILLLDGSLSRTDGISMLLLFIAWLVFTIFEARKQRESYDPGTEIKQKPAIVAFNSIGGLLILFLAGRLIVMGASGIAIKLGLSEFVIGAIIVAIGTSVPELATALISRYRGHNDIGLNAILGSNIFNGLFIVSVAAIIHPISANRTELFPVILVGLISVLMIIPSSKDTISRMRGFILLAIYIIYVIWTISAGK